MRQYKINNTKKASVSHERKAHYGFSQQASPTNWYMIFSEVFLSVWSRMYVNSFVSQIMEWAEGKRGVRIALKTSFFKIN